jgi:hypothetical protein
MSNRVGKEKEMERAAAIETRRQEAQDARAAYSAARNEAERLRKEYLRKWETIEHAAHLEAAENWIDQIQAWDARTRSALAAYKRADNALNKILKVAERDEVREAARIARAAERSAQKQQELRAIKLREKKAAQFKKAMDLMRERLTDANDFYL